MFIKSVLFRNAYAHLIFCPNVVNLHEVVVYDVFKFMGLEQFCCVDPRFLLA